MAVFASRRPAGVFLPSVSPYHPTAPRSDTQTASATGTATDCESTTQARGETRRDNVSIRLKKAPALSVFFTFESFEALSWGMSGGGLESTCLEPAPHWRLALGTLDALVLDSGLARERSAWTLSLPSFNVPRGSSLPHDVVFPQPRNQVPTDQGPRNGPLPIIKAHHVRIACSIVCRR